MLHCRLPGNQITNKNDKQKPSVKTEGFFMAFTAAIIERERRN